MWEFITDFGDSAVCVPLALFILAYLAWFARWRLAVVAWCGWGAACALALIVAKLYLRACSPAPGGGLVSPSGHAAIAILVYCGLATLVATQLPSRWRAIPWLLGVAAGVAVAQSRLALHAHTGPEIVIGLAIGLPCAAGFAISTLRTPPPRFALTPLAVGVILIAAALHGLRLPVEQMLAHFAAIVRSRMNVCV